MQLQKLAHQTNPWLSLIFKLGVKYIDHFHRSRDMRVHVYIIPATSQRRKMTTSLLNPYLIPSLSLRSSSHHLVISTPIYEVGFGFIFLLPPVMVTFTQRRVYVILFFARPLGVFFFSWGSTYIIT